MVPHAPPGLSHSCRLMREAANAWKMSCRGGGREQEEWEREKKRWRDEEGTEKQRQIQKEKETAMQEKTD